MHIHPFITNNFQPSLVATSEVRKGPDQENVHNSGANNTQFKSIGNLATSGTKCHMKMKESKRGLFEGNNFCLGHLILLLLCGVASFWCAPLQALVNELLNLGNIRRI